MHGDLVKARQHMIDSQLRPSDVTNADLLEAFKAVARDAHLPDDKRAIAYSDLDIEIGHGRHALRPRDLGKLLQELAPGPGDHALEIGAGGGYGAALLSRICRSVIALEPEPDLARLALAAFETAVGDKVKVVTTNPQFGWADAAPYSLILVQGGVEIVPQAWLDQLSEGGRLGVIVRSGATGSARIYLKQGGQTSYRVAFDAAPPVMPGLEAPRGFSF